MLSSSAMQSTALLCRTPHLNFSNKNKALISFGLFILLILSIPVLADIQPRSASLNYSQKALSNAGNPASAALIVARKDPHVMTGGSIEIGGGIEYGNLDELFAKIDELTLLFNPPPELILDPEFEVPPLDFDDTSRDYQWVDLFQKYPDLEDRLDIIKTKVATTAGILALIASEGYGKAEITSDASFVLNEDLFGGTLLFGVSARANSKALGLFDHIPIDLEQAKTELQKIPDFNEDDPIQELDLSGGVTLYYDPSTQAVKMSLDNDSLLLVKATKIVQFSFSYSNQAFHSDKGDLYWGVKPTYYRVGLTHASTRIGEITDTEALFNDINDAKFIYENGFDADFGLVWSADHYQLGASITSIFEHTYDFPEFERDNFRSENILNQLSQQESFTMERQLKLEAGIFTDQRHWSLHAELDANAVSDPMHDDYQWLTITGGYAADSWWLPSARIGFSRNLAGTKLAYINAGVTMMKFINLDVATTIDTVSLDGKEMRRGANIRLGVQFDY